MNGEQIFEHMAELKIKFKDFFQQRKQMTALENHSIVKAFNEAEREVFGTIRYCMKGAFLEDEDAEWIAKKLKKLEINYLDWAHRTKWLKEQLNQAQSAKKPKIIQTTMFDYLPKHPTMQVPVQVMAKQIKPKYTVRPS